MAIDAKNRFSHEQAETTIAAHDSTNVLDLGAANPNTGGASPKWVNVTVQTTFTSAGAATLSVSLQHSTDASTYVALATTQAFAVAALAKGKVLMSIPLPAEHYRYLKLVYTIGASAMTAGKLNAQIQPHPAYSRT